MSPYRDVRDQEASIRFGQDLATRDGHEGTFRKTPGGGENGSLHRTELFDGKEKVEILNRPSRYQCSGPRLLAADDSIDGEDSELAARYVLEHVGSVTGGLATCRDELTQRARIGNEVVDFDHRDRRRGAELGIELEDATADATRIEIDGDIDDRERPGALNVARRHTGRRSENCLDCDRTDHNVRRFVSAFAIGFRERKTRGVDLAGYQDLGSLKGNVGNQNYEILANVDVSALASVVIYCAPFHVVFAVAPLKTSG